jgi:hypothetical protein
MNSGLRTISPIPKVRAGYYCRLFPEFAGSFGENLSERLGALADSMMRGGIPVPGPSIPAGYTYFGQFIDHDLSLEDLEELPPWQDCVPPENTQNHRRSFLNLDNLYGGGPGKCSPDRNLYQDDGLYFKLGAALSNGQCFDVPLDENCKPLVADTRNVENKIVRQIHAMFLLLHNKAAKHFGDFENAQRWVRHQFQYLVLCDYLPQVCNQAVLDAMREHPNSLIDWSDEAFAIPVEFSRAAFRFGHSMVKSKYRLGEGNLLKPVCLSELFGGPKSPGALQTRLAVPWTSFLLKSPSEFHELADFIDTRIGEQLFHIPDQALAVFAAPGKKAEITEQSSYEPRLPLRTLTRGAASRLATGQQAKDIACPQNGINPTPPNYENDPWQPLKDYGFQEQTPLWYYILLEAQLNELGNSLGTLGSMIVAGTIEGALWSNSESYVHKCDIGLPPPLWDEPSGGRTELRTLFDVARYVGLA